MHTLWKRYVTLLENDLSTQIFDNVKNLLANRVDPHPP